jgi:hypothetical protein
MVYHAHGLQASRVSVAEKQGEVGLPARWPAVHLEIENTLTLKLSFVSFSVSLSKKSADYSQPLVKHFLSITFGETTKLQSFGSLFH